MARIRRTNRDKAFKVYKKYGRNIANCEIASMLNEDKIQKEFMAAMVCIYLY